MKIKKGDKVKILLGKDNGKEGKVAFVIVKRKKVFVEGANLYKKHVKKQGSLEGGIISIPKPLDVSNVCLICPSCNKPTRVGYKFIGTEKRRICKKCGKEITINAKT
jgi:large subunit ribosomal protein L24